MARISADDEFEGVQLEERQQDSIVLPPPDNSKSELIEPEAPATPNYRINPSEVSMGSANQ